MTHDDFKALDDEIEQAINRVESLAYRLVSFRNILESAKIIQASQEFRFKRVRYSIPFLLNIEDENTEYKTGYKAIVKRIIPDMTWTAVKLFKEDCDHSGKRFHSFTANQALALDQRLIEICEEIIDGKYKHLISESGTSKVIKGDTGIVLQLEFFMPVDQQDVILTPTYSIISVEAGANGEYNIKANKKGTGDEAKPYIVDMARLI